MSEFMKADDPVRIVPYDVKWSQWFQQLAQPLRQALGPVALRIDHIGSTSIPELAAKPIIDIQISVADFEPLDAYRWTLESLGYLFRADHPNLTQRSFREPPDQPRVHIHVMRAGSFGEQFALLFRDYMRVHPDVAAQYAAMKIGLAQHYQRAEEYQLYNQAKRPWMWKVVREADGWAWSVEWFPGPCDA